MLCLLAILLFQVRIPTEGVNPEQIYGPAEPAEVGDLVAGAFARRPVVTRGVLGILEPGRYFTLQDGAARVTVIPMPGFGESLGPLVGTRVEVKGYVRKLVENQGTCRFRGDMNAPQSVCEDPELPPKPDLDTLDRRLRWPPTSITIWSIADAPQRAGKGSAKAEPGSLFSAPGERVELRGQFGGANLGQALSSAAPDADAWVLIVEETAIWVVGKAPRGSGFRLDPGYRGDLGKWLEVEGRMAVCRGTPCLKASRIKLSAPAASEEDP